MNKQELIKKYENEWKEHSLFNETASYALMVKSFLDQLKKMDEPQKVTIPQSVADWIEVCKEHLTSSLYLAMTPSFLKANNQSIELISWIKKKENQETFALAWINGYEVEKEKRYRVKMKGISSNMCYLNRVGNKWIIAGIDEHTGMNIYTKHTKKELEDAGFGWIFSCEGIEVEEVE